MEATHSLLKTRTCYYRYCLEVHFAFNTTISISSTNTPGNDVQRAHTYEVWVI